MEKIEFLKCMTFEEMFKVVSSLTDIDTALDVMNKHKRNEKVVLEWVGDNLKLKEN
jgi:hypothetical protein